MKLAALQTLIAAGESQTLEFKASFDKACIATLVAFANAQGGTVLVPYFDAWSDDAGDEHLDRSRRPFK